MELPECFLGGGGSSLGKGESAERFYTDGATRAKFDELVQGEEYDLLIRRYRNGKLETESGWRVELKARASRLVTNDPERWECTVWCAEI